MPIPHFGEQVHVWPLEPNVQDGAGHYGRFLAPEGRDVAMDEFWAARLQDGSVTLRNPVPAPAAKASKAKE